VRLYLMNCGFIRARKNIYVPSVGKDTYIDSPMPVFLITHPAGQVLFDTGPNPEVFADPERIWGGLAKAFTPIGRGDSGVIDQLRKIGVAPGDIRYVVNSHLHFDHAGGNRFFPQAIFFVAAEELECARRPDLEGKGYIRSDWDVGSRYRPLEGELDLFGDGRLVILPLPGHTPGHQVLLVRLVHTGAVVLTGDAAPCRENFYQRVLARNNLDDEAARRSLERLRDLAVREKAMLIHGHDPEQWAGLRKAPDFYD
jgi:N-acyl homoserine lactone hydrolase